MLGFFASFYHDPPFPMSSSLDGVRVLCFYPWNPFEPSGAWSRFSSLWRYLLGEGAAVTLAFLEQGQDSRLKNLSLRFVGEGGTINNIGQYSQRILAADAKSELRHYSADELSFLLMFEKTMYLRSPQAAAQIESIIAQHDVVTCEYPMQVPLLSEFCRKTGRPLVVTSHDMLFELHGSHPGAKERLKQAEVRALKLADAVVHCSEVEQRGFDAMGIGGLTVPNTGDAVSLQLGDEAYHQAAIRAELKLKTADYCLFVGSSHRPNVDAAAEVKRIAKAFPKMSFIVAGACHPKTEENNFYALGRVRERLLDSLYRGAFAVLIPLGRGTGMSLKTFQAFAYGKAVVSTAIGARGFSAKDNEHFLLVQSPLEIAAGLRRLLADDGLRKRLGENAHTFALELDFRHQFRPYAEIINRLLRRAPTTTAKRQQTLFLVDNHLSDRIGHHYNYTLSIKEACERIGRPFASLLNRAAPDDVLSELSGSGIFDQKLHDAHDANPYPVEWPLLRSTYEFLLANAAFARELEEGLRQRACAEDVIFLPNATPAQLLGVALLLQIRPVTRTLTFVLLVRYSLQVVSGPLSQRKSMPDRELIDRYALAFEKLRGIDQIGCIRLVTDSAELAKDYSALWKEPVEVLPIPHTLHHGMAPLPREVPPKDPKKIRLVFMGDAREEKGFELLPPLVRSCAVSPAAGMIEFVFQSFVSSPYHARMGLVIDELERLNRPNLHLLKRSLSVDEYQGLLQSADIVLLPYDAQTYRGRTSGPFMEAICANKPVVVPRSTWMSLMLGNSEAGVTFQSGNAADFVRAVLMAVEQLPQRQEAALHLGQNFRSEHNPDTFVKRLLPT